MATKRHLAAALIATLTLAGCASREELQTVYCYRTLADVACYTEPDPGRESRLVGTYQRRLDGAVEAADDAPAPQGALARWLGASLELAGRLISPVGSIVGLVADP
ncbi:MAG: hypothetical protein AB7I59_17120 [Geminicoccaceae bacterium]